ncbi:PREDICTED: uncharacterized protein LOC109485238 [Branchiostoma belcheri]|uniref:Uncharacterized protein LOC109485238 n=1 Tax=Branchiostoma belcheri TaxID=7741 RepID=A0A6P5AD58_BRABE|nr:PREDICTED: uncharacterized protein LOC109485238 [Branchiostoma belcheri]
MHRFLSVPELNHRQEWRQDGRKFLDHSDLRGTNQPKMSTSQNGVEQVLDKTSRDEDGALLLADIERVADEISILEKNMDNITSRSRTAAGLFWPMLSLNIHQLSEQLSSVHSALNRLGRDKAVAGILRQQLRDTETKLESLTLGAQKVGDIDTVDSRQVLLHSKCGEGSRPAGSTEILQNDAVEEWLKRAEQGSTSSHDLHGAVEDHLRKENERSKLLEEELTVMKERYEKNPSVKVPPATTPAQPDELSAVRALLAETENRLRNERDQNKSLRESVASLRQVQEERDAQNKELEEEVDFLQKMLEEADERFDAEITDNTFAYPLHTQAPTGRRHMSLETLNDGRERMNHSPARRCLSFEDTHSEAVINTHRMPQGRVETRHKGGLSVSQPNLFTSHSKMAEYAPIGHASYTTPGRPAAGGQEWRQSPRVQQITADLQSKLHAAEEDLQRERGRCVDKTREIHDLRAKLTKEAESKKKLQVSFAMLRSRMKELLDKVHVEEDRHRLEKRSLLQEISELRNQTGAGKTSADESILSSPENSPSCDFPFFVMSPEISQSSDDVSVESGLFPWGGDREDDGAGDGLVGDLTSRLRAREDELRAEAMKAKARGREIVRLRKEVVRLNSALLEREKMHSSPLYRTRSETNV